MDKKVQMILNNEDVSKSQKMIELYNLGLKVKDISGLMNVRYNFVYNVISNYCNVNQVKLTTVKKEDKKSKIIELFEKGLSNKEISIELRTNYNYVFNVLKKYKEEKTDGQNVQ